MVVSLGGVAMISQPSFLFGGRGINKLGLGLAILQVQPSKLLHWGIGSSTGSCIVALFQLPRVCSAASSAVAWVRPLAFACALTIIAELLRARSHILHQPCFTLILKHA